MTPFPKNFTIVEEYVLGFSLLFAKLHGFNMLDYGKI